MYFTLTRRTETPHFNATTISENNTGWFFGHRYGDLESLTGRAAEFKMLDEWLNNDKDNLLMLAEIRRRRLHTSVVVDAETAEDAVILYRAGATYVIFPHFVGGLHLGDLVKKGVKNKEDFEDYRKYQQEVMAGVYA